MSNNPPLSALSLDAAGTMIGVTEPVAQTYVAIATDFGLAVSSQSLTNTFSRRFACMPPMAFPGLTSVRALQWQERNWWRQLVRSCFGGAANHPRFNDFFDALYEHYRSSSAWKLYPDSLALLDGADAAGLPMAVTSNFDSRLIDILRDLGVLERFQAVLYSTAVGSAKPNPAIFQQACAELHAQPGRTLHIGDSTHADLVGARNAGLRALLIRRHACPASPPDKPQNTISDLRAALAFLS